MVFLLKAEFCWRGKNVTENITFLRSDCWNTESWDIERFPSSLFPLPPLSLSCKPKHTFSLSLSLSLPSLSLSCKPKHTFSICPSLSLYLYLTLFPSLCLTIQNTHSLFVPLSLFLSHSLFVSFSFSPSVCVCVSHSVFFVKRVKGTTQVVTLSHNFHSFSVTSSFFFFCSSAVLGWDRRESVVLLVHDVRLLLHVADGVVVVGKAAVLNVLLTLHAAQKSESVRVREIVKSVCECVFLWEKEKVCVWVCVSVCVCERESVCVCGCMCGEFGRENGKWDINKRQVRWGWRKAKKARKLFLPS